MRGVDRGVVDHHVDPAHALHDPRDQVGRRVGFGEVGPHQDVPLTGQTFQGAVGLLWSGGAVDGDAFTLFGEGHGDRPADPPGGAGDQDVPVQERPPLTVAGTVVRVPGCSGMGEV